MCLLVIPDPIKCQHGGGPNNSMMAVQLTTAYLIQMAQSRAVRSSPSNSLRSGETLESAIHKANLSPAAFPSSVFCAPENTMTATSIILQKIEQVQFYQSAGEK